MDANNGNEPNAVVRSSDLKRMFEAIENNEEAEVTRLIGVNRNIVRARHPFLGETALHHAVSIGNIPIVRRLVESMDREELEIKDRLDMNALGLAARTGNVEIARYLVEKNHNLVNVCNDRRLPVELALQYDQKELGRYLYVATPMRNFVGDNREQGASVIRLCIVHSLPEIALHLLHHHPELTIAETIHTRQTPIYSFSSDIRLEILSGSHLRRSDRNTYDGNRSRLLQSIECWRNIEAAKYLLASIGALNGIVPNFVVNNCPNASTLATNLTNALAPTAVNNHVAQNIAKNLAQSLREVIDHQGVEVAQNLAQNLEATQKLAQNLAQNLLAANLQQLNFEVDHYFQNCGIDRYFQAQDDADNVANRNLLEYLRQNFHIAQNLHTQNVKDAHNLAQNIEATKNLAQNLLKHYAKFHAEKMTDVHNILHNCNDFRIIPAQNLEEKIREAGDLRAQKLIAENLAQSITDAQRFAQNFAENLQANDLARNIADSQTSLNNLRNARGLLENFQDRNFEASQSLDGSLGHNVEDAERLFQGLNDVNVTLERYNAVFLDIVVAISERGQRSEQTAIKAGMVLVMILQVQNLIQNPQAQNLASATIQTLRRNLRDRLVNFTALRNRAPGFVQILQIGLYQDNQNNAPIDYVVPPERRLSREWKRTEHQRTLAILNCMYKHIIGLQENRMKMANVDKALEEAARRGLLDVFETINNANPSILRHPIAFGVFSVAVRYRHRNIFSLLQRMPSRNAITNTVSMTKTGEKYSILQHAALLAPANHLSKIPGPALQMKSELEWFEEVKQNSTVFPHHILEAEKLFTKEHKELKSAGEKWMKDTATACSLVGSLIITVMFPMALSVPGGSLDKNEDLIRAGSPILLHDKWFMIFVTFDAISLFSATCSVLMFLAILTSRYQDEDFRTSLPRKLVMGLIFLLTSVGTMALTFCAALMIHLRDKHLKSLHYLFFGVVITIGLFFTLHYKIPWQMVKQTYQVWVADFKELFRLHFR